MKFSVSCTKILIIGYNFHDDIVFPHVTTDAHLPDEPWVQTQKRAMDEQHISAQVCGWSPSRRDDFACALTRPAFSLEIFYHTLSAILYLQCTWNVTSKLRQDLFSHACSSELSCCAFSFFFCLRDREVCTVFLAPSALFLMHG